jgi:hypothetical protein
MDLHRGSISCLENEVLMMIIRIAPTLIFLVYLFCPAASRAYDFIGQLLGENIGDQYGSTFCTVDFNADGFQDLVISAAAADDAGVSSGKVYVYFGGPGADLLADLTLVGAASSFYGQALASAGDFNNDGSDDLLVGAPFYDIPAQSAGAVYLYYGGSSPDTTVDHIFTGEAASDYFGTSVNGTGDFNGDGFNDIAIGAYRADWGAFQNSGKTYVYYGGDPPDFVADKILVGEADGERFGFSITSGDFTGDDTSDIAVGAYSFDSGQSLNLGRIYVFEGGSPPDTVFDLAITGDSSGNKFGWSLASGRVTADAFDDIVMGTDGFPIDTFSAGRVYVFDGGPSLDASPFATYDLGRHQHDYLGFSVGSGADIDGDGHHDVITGMPGNSDGGDSTGGAILLSGGVSLSVDTSVVGDSPPEQMGHSVHLWPDYGDGEAFVMSAIGYGDFRGRVWLFATMTDTTGCCQGMTGNVDGDVQELIDIGDLTALIAYLYIGPAPPKCLAEANIDGDGEGLVDIGDLTRLIDYLYIAGTLPSPCQ